MACQFFDAAGCPKSLAGMPAPATLTWHTAALGDQVEFLAFHQWKRGSVCGLGRKRVLIKFTKDGKTMVAIRPYSQVRFASQL